MHIVPSNSEIQHLLAEINLLTCLLTCFHVRRKVTGSYWLLILSTPHTVQHLRNALSTLGHAAGLDLQRTGCDDGEIYGDTAPLVLQGLLTLTCLLGRRSHYFVATIYDAAESHIASHPCSHCTDL